jgi:NitT/TauT family transport system substrate-binding protein
MIAKHVVPCITGCLALALLSACGGQAPAPASSAAPAASVSAAPVASKPAAPAASASAPPATSAAPSAAVKPSGGAKHLKVGTLPTIGNAPFIIAQQKGYFSQEGLDVELINFTSGAETIPQLASGQIDAANSVTPSAGLINAVARDLPVRIVADDGTIKKDRNIANILIRKQLQPNAGQYVNLASLSKPIKAAATASDLVPDAILKLQLQQAGVSAADVQFNYLGLPDINVSLKNGNIDVAASGEPLITIAVQQDLATRWKPMADIAPNMPYSNLLFGPNLREKDKAAGEALVRGFLKGVRDYENAFTKGTDKNPIIAMIGPPLHITPELFKAMQDGGGLAYLNPDGAVSIDALQPIVNFWIQQKSVQATSFDVNTLVDSSFADAAVKTLGKYQG